MFDVVMPLYNKEAFVGEAIKSILAQSFADWRLFVVDDGSTDRSAECVRRFDDSRIQLIQQRNQGVGPARNTGLRSGSAEWIAFLDADDVWRPDHLEELNALRCAFPEAALIGCAFRRFSAAAAPPQNSGRKGERRLVRYFGECARGRELFVTSSAAVRRSAIAEVGEFKPLPGNEDVELWARLALHAPVAFSARRTVSYRVDTGGITDAGMAGRRSASKPEVRQDLSSTIPTLEVALAGLADPTLRQEIQDYMDSRIGIRLVAAVIEGDMSYARRLRGLYRGAPKGKARIAAALARLPVPMGRIAVTAGRKIKALVARSANSA